MRPNSLQKIAAETATFNDSVWPIRGIVTGMLIFLISS